MVKKQGKVIVVFSAAFAGLLVLYLLVIAPMLIPPEIEVELPDLFEGEVMGMAGRIMIAPRVDRRDIKYVTVQNHVDEYRVVRHEGHDSFFVETAEFAHVDQEKLSQFFVNTGYLLSMLRVAARDIDDGNEILEDLEQFGFHENSARFTVTKLDGSWYRVIIGDRIPTYGGYYVMYEDENGLREAIYILDTMMSDTVLSNRYSLLVPLVTVPVRTLEQTMLVDNFRFYRGQDLFVHIHNAEIPEDSLLLVNRQMLYPAPYEVSDYFTDFLTGLLSGLTGERVVHAFGIDDEGFDAEILERFGFLPYAGKITFTLNDMEYFIMFSEPNEDGNYYVFSIDLQTVVEIRAEDVPFFSWGLRRFIEREIFFRNIGDVAEIAVNSEYGKTHFILGGTARDLTVMGGEYGGVLEPIEDVQNFRRFYMGLLSIALWEEEDDPREEDTEPLAELIVTMRNGTVYAYRFYFVPTNTRRSFFTVNGNGQFYVMRDRVIKLIHDTARVLSGEPIDPDIFN